jgi:hypothetical protein
VAGVQRFNFWIALGKAPINRPVDRADMATPLILAGLFRDGFFSLYRRGRCEKSAD